MENHEPEYTVSPNNLILDDPQAPIHLNVKNTSLRTCHYEIFVPDNHHFKVTGNRTFSLAPGISKNVKIKHIASQSCNLGIHTIQIVDSFGNKRFVEIACKEQKVPPGSKIQMQSQIRIQQMKIGQERRIHVEIKNISSQNIKIKIHKAFSIEFEEKILHKLGQDSLILLANSQKKVKMAFKMLQQAQVTLDFDVESIQEESRSSSIRPLRIICNSLQKSQFVADQTLLKTEYSQHFMLNGTSLKGSFYLVNNYHEACPFKILQIIQIQDYQIFTQKLSQANLRLFTKEGTIEAKSQVQIQYEIKTQLNENDKSFILRYGQLSPKDQPSSYKFRNGKYFKKNIEMVLRVQFGKDHSINYRIKNHITNAALRVMKKSSPNIDNFSIVNDSGCDVPFRVLSHLGYTSKPEKGVLNNGLNSVQIYWKQVQQFSSATKENYQPRYPVRMQLPGTEFMLFEPTLPVQVRPTTAFSRPKTAIVKDQSRVILTKQTLRQKISTRAPVKKGDLGIKTFINVTQKSYLSAPGKYLKPQLLSADQFHHLQMNQNNKGFVLTNSHQNKNIMVLIHEKGFLFMESQCSYCLPFDRKILKVEHNGRLLELRAKEIDDRQPYKFKSRELIFCFGHNQTQFEVVKQLQILNRSSDRLVMYCLSVDDEYFHSLQAGHKVTIEPNSSQTYKISLRPESQQCLKQGKITRYMQFLINDNKEIITCEGDLLHNVVTTDFKEIQVSNCAYSEKEVRKNLTIHNKGLHKVSYRIENAQQVKITPAEGTISEKGKQTLSIILNPSELPKQYSQTLILHFKGSHLIRLPLTVTTTEPDIYCEQSMIDFKEGYLNQQMTQIITIVNNNDYDCSLKLNYDRTNIKGDKSVVAKAQQKKEVQLTMTIKELGTISGRLPQNFIQLKGYGAIRSPKEFKLAGKKTVLELLPSDPFKNYTCYNHQETHKFAIRNISSKPYSISTVLTPKTNQKALILSLQPKSIDLQPGEEQQLRMYSIRTDEEEFGSTEKKLQYNISIFFNNAQKQLYRSIDFKVNLPPPQLEVYPKEIYFPLSCVGSWSTTTFTVHNQGHKQVFISVKKPININFDMEVQLEQGNNRLTKLKDKLQVKLLYKSKKAVSFGVIVEVQDNFGQKYEVKVYGTSSRSPLLKCDRGAATSVTGLSSREIKTVSSTSSLRSISALDLQGEEHQNTIFFNKWINGTFPSCARNGQVFNQWLKNPKNFKSFLTYLKVDIFPSQVRGGEQHSISDIMQQLKRLGYPVYIVQQKLLQEGSSSQWSMCLWLILSKETVKEECLKWVNRTCNIKLQTYDQAYNHHKKILINIMSKVVNPVINSKQLQWHKIVDVFEGALPFLSKIDNKRQFVFLLNLLYAKFGNIEVITVNALNFTHKMQLVAPQNSSTSRWLLSNNSFEFILPDNCSHDRYFPERKLLTFVQEGSTWLDLKFKEDTTVLVWNNAFEENAKIYNIQLSKKAPITRQVYIECQDKCTQEWFLKFPCQIQSQYFFQFSGANEFRCKMPQLGVIKSGDLLQFTVLYSPQNLRQHEATLIISNKYEEHIYKLKGKPLKTTLIEVQKTVTVFQGRICTEQFSIPQMATSASARMTPPNTEYVVNEIGTKTEQMKVFEAKGAKKEINITVVLEYHKIVRNHQILLQVTNRDMTYCKNIRLTINVTPKPVMIQAQLRGSLQRATIEKIPISNLLSVKQNCFISIYKIDNQCSQDVKNVHQMDLNSLQDHSNLQTERGEWQYSLSHLGKVVLKPKESTKVLLTYAPQALQSTCCQIRLKYQLSQQLIIYNFRGTPQVPMSERQLLLINCQTQTEITQTVKINNKLRERITFDVETNLNFIAGPETFTLQGRQQNQYKFKVRALHQGQCTGQLIFKNQKQCVIYPLKVTAKAVKQIKRIKIQGKIRITNVINIQLTNNLDKEVVYAVQCQKEYLSFPQTVTVDPRSENTLQIKYTPLFVGTKETTLKLYNEFNKQICYLLQMVSEEHYEANLINYGLGEGKTFRVSLKNPTKMISQLPRPVLPPYLSFKADNIFPLPLPAHSTTPLQLIFTPSALQKQTNCPLTLHTTSIGSYLYDLYFAPSQQKTSTPKIIEYEFLQQGEKIVKNSSIEVTNPFKDKMVMKIANQQIKYNSWITIYVENQTDTVEVQSFRKKTIGIRVEIVPTSSLQCIHSDRDNKDIVLSCGQFKWIFPIVLTQVRVMSTPISISGHSHQLLQTKIHLLHLASVHKWEVTSFPQYEKQLNLAHPNNCDLHLQAIIHKNVNYSGHITFYQADMTLAEKYPLNICTQGRKIKNITLEANVGDIATSKIKIKNGRGAFKVMLKNNRKKQFKIEPMEGVFSQLGQNMFSFYYQPSEYNGSKKAEAVIESQSGNFDFCLMGKFPDHKPK